MSSEEVERAIEFLVKSQAKHDAQLGQLTEQVTETGKQLQVYAQMQTQFIEICTRTMTGLAEAQARTERTMTGLAEAQARTNERVSQTDARLDRLAALIEQHVTEGHH